MKKNGGPENGCRNEKCEWSHNNELFEREPLATLLKRWVWEKTKKKIQPPPPQAPWQNILKRRRGAELNEIDET